MDVRISNQPASQLGLESPPTDLDAADEQSEQIKNRLASIFGGAGGFPGIATPAGAVVNQPSNVLPIRMGTVVQPNSTLPGGEALQRSTFLENPPGGKLPTGTPSSGTSSSSSLLDGLMNPNADYVDTSSDSGTSDTSGSTTGTPTGSTTSGTTTASTTATTTTGGINTGVNLTTTGGTAASGAAATSTTDATSGTPDDSEPEFKDGLVNAKFDFKLTADSTSEAGDALSSVTSDDGSTSNGAPTFGEAAKTLDNWAHTASGMQGKNATLDLNDLQDIANGTGMGAGASADVQAAAKEMLSDGGAQFKASIGGKDGKASINDFSKYVANDTSTPLTDDEMQTLSVLDRHADAIAGKDSDIQSKIDDPNTPSDLKTALQALQKDPSLMDMLDAGKNGKVDGKIGKDDISHLTSKRPEMVAYNQQLAQTYVDNYIPSDDTDSDAKPRTMDANDAMRELYRYSDYLPKNVSKQDLQNIVDGTGGEGKAPAQLKAAAQYMLSNPSAWTTVAGSSGSLSRGHMEDAISKNITLDQNENTTMQTISDNESTFFGGGNLTRDKLKSIAADSNNSDAVKTAAQQLLNDPMLFGMLDNGKHGSSGNLIYAADDGKIGKGDFDAFKSKLKSAGQVAETPATHEPTSASDEAAAAAMEAGTEDQPEQKKSKGGGLIKFFQGILHVFSKILDVVSTVLGALAKIPGIGEIFAGASVATKFVSGQANVVADAVGGADKAQIAKDEEQAAIGVGEAALGAVTVPGVGGALMKGAEEGAEAGVTASKGAIKDGIQDGVKDAAKDNVSDAATSEAQQQYQQRTAA